MTFESIITNIPYIIIGLLGFSVLVIWHELGHFTLAKLNGVKVEEFSVGMGKKLFGIKGKETEYNLRAFPIGGYVKMLGEEGECTDKRAFANKSNIRRLSIVMAGPIFNFILAIVLYSVFYMNMGTPIPVVGELSKNMPAAASGMEVGDKIIEANGSKITTWNDFNIFMHTFETKDVHLKIQRGDDIIEKVVKPVYNEEEKRYLIGFVPEHYKPQGISALKLGVDQLKSDFGNIGKFFGRLFRGKVSKDEVGGPVTIFKMTSSVAKLGFLPMLLFLGMISAQLGIFNILPVPALDGGWIVILTLQMITGKKFSDDLVGKVNYFGFMFLLGLMVLVTIKDLFFA